MNAREYLEKHGIALEREEDKPQSLEEKAWARAREAAAHGPRSGTPHDWEDWERFHEQLAADSESIGRKKRQRSPEGNASGEGAGKNGADGENGSQ